MAQKSKDSAQESSEQPGVFEDLGKRLDESPGVQAAEAAMRRAKTEFEKAQRNYQDARQQASKNLDELRDASLGEIVDHSLAYVRRHPGRTLGLAALLGFFLGRLFRR